MRSVAGVLVMMAAAFVPNGHEDPEPRIAVLHVQEEKPVIEVPDTVDAGAPFQVTVETVGGGCVEKGRTEVDVRGQNAVIIPYDREIDAADGCMLLLEHLQHTATLTFEEPGHAEVVVLGRDDPDGALIRVDRTVVVR